MSRFVCPRARVHLAFQARSFFKWLRVFNIVFSLLVCWPLLSHGGIMVPQSQRPKGMKRLKAQWHGVHVSLGYIC